MKNISDAKARKKVWELIQDIRFAQLVTRDPGEGLSSRPMAALNKEFTDTLWFFTAEGSPKTEDIRQNPNILLCYNKPDSQEYVSVQGKAMILNDRKKIAELWSEPCRTWFPEGKDDPSIRLISVEVVRAEYWDSPASKMVMLYDYVAASITGETPEVGENRKVAF